MNSRKNDIKDFQNSEIFKEAIKDIANDFAKDKNRSCFHKETNEGNQNNV